MLESRQLSPRKHHAIVAAAAVAATALIVKTAWLADDAYISLRVIDNFWNGYGLRWNAIERVQVYTHPLWLMVVGALYGFTREAYWTTITASIACTTATLFLFARRVSSSPATALVGMALFAGSNGFVDFSTSGLENPLSHLLIVWYLSSYWRSDGGARCDAELSIIAGLCVLNRLDSAVLLAPSLAVAVWRARAAKSLFAGLVPLVAWYGFAYVYYGNALPNTAYAKLPPGVAHSDLALQGVRYLRESLSSDPLTLLTIAAAVGISLFRGIDRSVALGCLAHVAYVTAVGGDFMSGRFLTPAFVAAVCVLCHNMRLPRFRIGVALAITITVLSVLSPRSAWRLASLSAAADAGATYTDGIVNERTVYAPYTGLEAILRGQRPADHEWATWGRHLSQRPQVVTYQAVGILGYHAGAGVHIIDPMGLTDPLLARLPPRTPWRIGHFERALPSGYEATVASCLRIAFPLHRIQPPKVSCRTWPGRLNAIERPDIAALYDRLTLLTQAPVFDRTRLEALLSGRTP